MAELGLFYPLLNAFAEAATDPSRWDAAMEMVARTTEAFGAALFPVEGKLPSVPRSRSLEASFDAYLRDGWIHRDERERCRPALERRGVATEFDFTSEDEMKRHPYYQEFLAPHGLRWFAGVKVACGEDFWCLSIQRTVEQGPFGPAEQQRLAELSRHLSSAAAAGRALGFARAEGAMAAFEASASGVVMVDRRGHVIGCNASAERLFGPDLRICSKRLVSWSHEATKALDGALKQLLWRPDPAGLYPPIRMPRRHGQPFLLYPLRLRGITGDVLSPCQALVVIVDLAQKTVPPEATLRTSFGLSAAEAKLARHVASGASVETARTSLGITYETARNQLKAVFAKTGTHRQHELVALLSRLLPS